MVRHRNARHRHRLNVQLDVSQDGTALVVAGFIVPPTGEVSDSVLWFFGECLIYAGSIFGISIYVNGKIHNIRRELHLPEEDEEKETQEEEKRGHHM